LTGSDTLSTLAASSPRHWESAIILSFDWVHAIRRNHATEHATIAILARRLDLVGQLGGRSVTNGFYIYGSVSTEAVEEAAREAVQRLRAGEEKLAISPFCGTNFLIAGVLSTVTTALVLGGRNRIGRLPQAFGAATLALIASFRIGAEVQRRWTTQPQVGGLRIERVVQMRGGEPAVHRVYTRSPEAQDAD
jgi:hypothetical protein